MATALGFAAQIDDWTKQTTQRMEAVFKESTQRTVNKMQQPVAAGGNMPVDTGFLRASIRASLSSMPQISGSATATGGTVTYDGSAVTAEIANAKLGQTIWVGYTAAYAGHVEYGAGGRTPRAFVGLAAAQWPAIVNEVVAELKSRAASLT